MIEWISFFLFAVAALIHFYFFYVESFVIQKSAYAEKMKISQETHNAIKPWAYNQGFYNLCLALGTCWGLSYVLKKQVMLAGILTGFCGLSMIVAGVALWFSVPRLRKLALLQLVPPLLGFVFLFFHIAKW